MKDFANKKSLIGHTPKRFIRELPVTLPKPLTKIKPARWSRRVVLGVVVLLVLALVVKACSSLNLSDRVAAIKNYVDAHRHGARTMEQNTQDDRNSAMASTATATPAPTTNQPTFDFYTVLPARGSNTASPAATAQNNAPTQTAPKAPLVLIVGTYQNQQDADKMRAHLLLNGLTPTIVTVNGQYQVTLGPFDSEQSLATAKARVQKIKD